MILHPALAVVLIYPLSGMVIRLGVQTRQRRMGASKIAISSGSEHTDLGRWLSAASVLIALIALAVVIATHEPISAFHGGAPRAIELMLVFAGTCICLLSLWRATSQALRLLFTLLTWIGVISLGAQPEVFRLGDNPFQPAFWQSHYWAGIALIGLMLFPLGARPEILRQLRWRRIHIAANLLAAVLLVVQGITGTRDLLEIPPMWQKPALQTCDWSTFHCPAPALPRP